MDNSKPITIILHFDYVPFDERTQDDGWEPDIIEYEIRDAIERVLRHTATLALVDLEVIEPPRRISVT